MADSTPPTLYPTTTEEVQQCVLAALGAGEPLEVLGGGSKRFYGHPVAAQRALSLSALGGVVDYQPGELIAVVGPGTPLATLETVLRAEGQTLAFEPPHWGEGATIGGVVGCNLAGPRRPSAGAARDHLLGFEAVTGRGEIIRGGGRVVKNVTGYDMSKLMCGSFGTLAVLTELVLKVLPAAETERTVAIAGLDEEAGLGWLTAVARSPNNPTGLAHLPPGCIAPGPLAGLAAGQAGLTLIRVEGPPPSVALRSGQIAQDAPRQAVFLEGEDSVQVWRALRELEPLPVGEGDQVWRFSVPPSAGVELVRHLRERCEPKFFLDWGGGLVWAALPATVDGGWFHGAARKAGGHGRILRAEPQGPAQTQGPAEPPGPAQTEGQMQPQRFPPLAGPKAMLHRNLKAGFDPQGILNPGRMFPGM